MARTNRFGRKELPDIGRYGHDVGAGYEFNPYAMSGDARFQPGAAKVNIASILEPAIPKGDEICKYGTYADGTCKPKPVTDDPVKPGVGITENGEVVQAPGSFYVPGHEFEPDWYVGADPTWAGGGDYPFKGAYGQPVGWTDKEGKAPYYTKSLLDEQKRMAGRLGDIKDPVRPDFSVGPGAELETVYEDPESYVDLGSRFLSILDPEIEARILADEASGYFDVGERSTAQVGGRLADKLGLLASADTSLSKKADFMKQENARITEQRKRIAEEQRKAEEAAENKRQQEAEAARRQAEADARNSEREERERDRAKEERERAIERKEKDSRNRAKEKAKKQRQQKSRKAAAKRRSDRASARSKAESSRAASQAAAARAASQAAARKRNIAAEKKREKRAEAAKKKGYRIGPDMRRR